MELFSVDKEIDTQQLRKILQKDLDIELDPEQKKIHFQIQLQCSH